LNIGSIFAGTQGTWFRVLLTSLPTVNKTFYCVPQGFAPFIEGDMMVTLDVKKVNTETGRLNKCRVKVGHIHTDQSPDGSRTWYFGVFTEVYKALIGHYLKVEE